jgi:hypothetical protein
MEWLPLKKFSALGSASSQLPSFPVISSRRSEDRPRDCFGELVSVLLTVRAQMSTGILNFLGCDEDLVFIEPISLTSHDWK